jgi:hypothetical protein
MLGGLATFAGCFSLNSRFRGHWSIRHSWPISPHCIHAADDRSVTLAKLLGKLTQNISLLRGETTFARSLRFNGQAAGSSPGTRLTMEKSPSVQIGAAIWCSAGRAPRLEANQSVGSLIGLSRRNVKINQSICRKRWFDFSSLRM